jgi:hypothetical protein
MRLIDIDPSLATLPKLDSGLVKRLTSLREKRVDELSLGDVAFCLRQGVAVAHIATRAMEVLGVQPLVEAELYSGDLLSAAVHAEGKGWLKPAQRAELRDVCSAALAGMAALTESVLPDVAAFVQRHDAV